MPWLVQLLRNNTLLSLKNLEVLFPYYVWIMLRNWETISEIKYPMISENFLPLYPQSLLTNKRTELKEIWVKNRAFVVSESNEKWMVTKGNPETESAKNDSTELVVGSASVWIIL